MSLMRIKKEFIDQIKNPLPNFWAGPQNEADPFHWQATIIGPDDTPFSGGFFSLDIHFTSDYPYESPKI